MASTDKFKERLDGVYFLALKGGVYHSLRADFFSFWRKVTVSFTFFLGLSSIIFACNIFSFGSFRFDVVAFLLSCLAFLISFLSFAFNFTDKIYFYKSFSNRWKDLVRRIDNKKSEEKGIEEKVYLSFFEESNLIIRDESQIYLGLDAVAYNSVSKNYGYKLIIPWYVRWLNNWCKFSDMKLAVVEIPESKSKTKKTDSKGK